MDDKTYWWVVSKVGTFRWSTRKWEEDIVKAFGLSQYQRYFKYDPDRHGIRRALLFMTSKDVYENIKREFGLRICHSIEGIDFLTSERV